MNKYATICIIMLSLCVADVCDVLCKTDGDERGILISNSCYCANPRDISKFVTRVPRQGTGKAIISKPRRYEENEFGM